MSSASSACRPRSTTASRTGCASAAAGKLKGDEATLFTGEFWTGRRGLELGLVDSLGELRAVLQARYGAKVHLPVVAARRRLLSRLRLRLRQRHRVEFGPATPCAALEERAHWQRFGL